MESTNILDCKEIKITLTPNPATDNVQIGGFEGVAEFVISDIFCRTLLKKRIVCDELVSLKSISRGVYIAKVITQHGIERKKLEKK